MTSRSLKTQALRSLLGTLCAAASCGALAAPTLVLSSPGTPDGGTLSHEHAASANQCGGQNVSPALEWTQVPANTKSYAVTVMDPAGGQGLGIVHWVMYSIPASLHGLPAGAGTAPPAGSVSGINRTGKGGYYGPCPPVGDTPHPYIVQAYALDLAPGAIPANLTLDALHTALRGHILGSAAIVLRYAR